MTGAAREWPQGLAGTAGAAVIDRAIDGGRLSRGILLDCEDPDLLEGAAAAVAGRLLRMPDGSEGLPPARHPDCFFLRPSGKSRIIDVDSVRDLIGNLAVSPMVAPRKVAVIVEADRMHPSAANSLLKVLEEPPADTTILLLSGRPYALLPTIRSRVLHFRFPSDGVAFAGAGWPGWRADYLSWLESLRALPAQVRKSDQPAKSTEAVMAVYGLLARFGVILGTASEEAWNRQKELLPAGLEDDELAAAQAGMSQGLRQRLLAEVALTTRQHARASLEAGDSGIRRDLGAAIDALERTSGLLRLNLTELAALEEFLLVSLRLWSRR